MLQILNVIVPIYVLIGIGYVMTRFGPFKKDEMRILGKFVLNLALPALIIRSLANNSIQDVLYWPYLAAYLVFMICVCPKPGISTLIAWQVAKRGVAFSVPLLWGVFPP